MRLPLALFGLALLVRAVSAAAFGDPAYPDSFYHVHVARALAAGDGFHVDYIWNFVDVGGRLPPDPGLPIPSNAHWMPLAAVVQVPFIWLLGPTELASGLPFWLAAATVAPITWTIARDAGLERSSVIAAGILAAVPGAVSPFLSQPDNFALFMPLGTVTLWACGRGMGGDRRAFVVGGLLVGVATLARNDGVLLGVPFALAFAADLLRRPRASRIGWSAAVACAAAFVLVMAPWWFRQLEVFGSLSPSAATGRILWIADYRDLYSIGGEPPTPSSLLARGPAAFLETRFAGLASALVIFATVPLLFFMVPFVVRGMWLRWSDPSFRPWRQYAATLLGCSALLFAVHVPYGTFLHSAVALVPHAYVLALLGIAATVRGVAARRRTWEPDRATRILSAGTVGVAVVAAVGATLIVGRTWGREQDVRREVAAALASVPPGERVMSPDAGAYRYLAGRPGIVTPDDPLPVVEAALRAYHIRWLVLERDHIVPALAPVLAGRERPAWLSRPIAEVTRPAASSAASAARTATAGSEATLTADDLPAAALYAVCLSESDRRCAP